MKDDNYDIYNRIKYADSNLNYATDYVLEEYNFKSDHSKDMLLTYDLEQDIIGIGKYLRDHIVNPNLTSHENTKNNNGDDDEYTETYVYGCIIKTKNPIYPLYQTCLLQLMKNILNVG